MLYLQVSELAKGLAASIQAAHKGLDLVMDALVRLQVSELSKGLVAAWVATLVGPLAGVLAFVSLHICKRVR